MSKTVVIPCPRTAPSRTPNIVTRCSTRYSSTVARCGRYSCARRCGGRAPWPCPNVAFPHPLEKGDVECASATREVDGIGFGEAIGSRPHDERRIVPVASLHHWLSLPPQCWPPRNPSVRAHMQRSALRSYAHAHESAGPAAAPRRGPAARLWPSRRPRSATGDQRGPVRVAQPDRSSHGFPACRNRASHAAAGLPPARALGLSLLACC